MAGFQWSIENNMGTKYEVGKHFRVVGKILDSPSADRSPKGAEMMNLDFD